MPSVGFLISLPAVGSVGLNASCWISWSQCQLLVLLVSMPAVVLLVSMTSVGFLISLPAVSSVGLNASCWCSWSQCQLLFSWSQCQLLISWSQCQLLVQLVYKPAVGTFGLTTSWKFLQVLMPAGSFPVLSAMHKVVLRDLMPAVVLLVLQP
jgi:hypothetical protein